VLAGAILGIGAFLLADLIPYPLLLAFQVLLLVFELAPVTQQPCPLVLEFLDLAVAFVEPAFQLLALRALSVQLAGEGDAGFLADLLAHLGLPAGAHGRGELVGDRLIELDFPAAMRAADGWTRWCCCHRVTPSRDRARPSPGRRS
jgi:hypothetical protein